MTCNDIFSAQLSLSSFKMTKANKYIFSIFVLIFTLTSNTVAAQDEAQKYNVDSTLYQYYQRCRMKSHNPTVLAMSDTLFSMAGEKNDLRMQAVAISTKLDYYYYMANPDSIIQYTNQVKEFARKTNQPKYYYFAWGQRLILHYILQGKLTIALYEAEKMLKEAQATEDKIGLMTCYHCMGTIYDAKIQKKQAAHYRMEELNLIEKHKLDNYNLTTLYVDIAGDKLFLGQPKEALVFIKKAEATASSSLHKLTAMLRYVNYYVAIKDFSSAKTNLDRAWQMFNSNESLRAKAHVIYSAEVTYYKATKQYEKTIQAVNNMQSAANSRNEVVLNNARRKIMGEIYHEMGNTKLAAQYFSQYIAQSDSLRIAQEEKTSSEFATLLNVEKLNNENIELTLLSQQASLQSRKLIMLLMAGLLIIIGVVFYRENRMNRRLKQSQVQLRQRNAELVESQKELSMAKERAEDASKMKTNFIQSMSHEIRTPLNSIVGFSQVLTHLLDQNEEVKQCSDMIDRASNDLLKLVSDVIDLSNLDSSHDKLPVETLDLDIQCNLCLEPIRQMSQPGVEVLYIAPPAATNTMVESNAHGLSLILTNLLHNAAKFTQKGSITLALSINENQHTATITVTDTGRGIEPEKQELIFERFVKLDDFSQGTGLGLSICRSAAQRLAGTLIVDKDYTTGTRFILTVSTDLQGAH